MADTLSSNERSAVMSAVRSRRNKSTEERLIRILRLHGVSGWRRGARFFGNPDFVFRKERVALFVDGCFWHGCPQHCRMPSTNRVYWERKIHRNRVRDRLVDRTLRANG
ncbi:MAG: very short patch repair endonuclease [Chthoniobacterales bacterium]